LAKRLCIAIAVSKPDGLEEVPGAIPSATRLADWASGQGYDVALVTDKPDPVTCARLADIFHEKLGAGGQERVIIAFAGHGLIRGGAEEYWLLSGWRTRATEAVNYLKLRDRLSTYRPRQIAIVSDACRSLPTERAKWVEGNGVIDIKDYVETPVEVALLNSTRAAQPSYSSPPPLGAEEAYCFFTQVVANALAGSPEDAVQLDAEGRAVVLNDNLLNVIDRELPLLASRYQRRQVPDLQGGWRAPKNVWSLLPSKSPNAPAPLIAPHPSPDGTFSFRNLDERDTKAAAALATSEFVDRLRSEDLRSDFRPETGIAFAGAVVDRLVLSSGSTTPPNAREINKFELKLPQMERAATVMARLTDGSWVGAAIYEGFVGNFSIGEDGADSYVLRPSWGNADTTQRVVAMAAVGQDLGDPFELAARMRDQKHIDPVLGALASYAYARAGAIEDIRRLCYFYREHRQPLPFDAALLARVPIRPGKNGNWVAHIPKTRPREPRNSVEQRRAFTYRATPAAEIEVAGHFPWLRQGWALLEDDFRPEFRRLAEFVPGLRPGLFSSFKRASGEALAALIEGGM
jgi:hypothetical protein